MTPYVEGYRDAINSQPANETICHYEDLLNRHNLLNKGSSYVDGYRQGKLDLNRELSSENWWKTIQKES